MYTVQRFDRFVCYGKIHWCNKIIFRKYLVAIFYFETIILRKINLHVKIAIFSLCLNVICKDVYKDEFNNNVS